MTQMKAVVVVLLALSASAVALVNPIYAEWKQWKDRYQPAYNTNAEDARRLRIFARNKHTVLELNRRYGGTPDGPRFGLNQFADLTPEEFAAQYLHPIPSNIPRFAYLPRLFFFLLFFFCKNFFHFFTTLFHLDDAPFLTRNRYEQDCEGFPEGEELG